ncbi:MAG: thioredoxin family protein [Bacteroidia bacterium]|nr:thioredoxin family protein [Bacteroidia bacterium]MBP7271157.1 thioredoxin family protein [Bacteroidia bacterium]MBP7773227.1 thioredoxin family protein [Bacteroidia bacterium]
MKQLLTTLVLVFVVLAAQAGYKVGDEARDFALKNIDGTSVSLSKFAGDTKGAIVIFTCNHCPFSVAYEDRILALDKKYAALGYPVIAINPNDAKIQPGDSYENMIERAKEKNFTFPYLHDETQEIASAFGAARTPHVYVLEREKDKFIVRYIGAIDNNSDEPGAVTSKFVEEAVDALVAGKPVTTAETKAIGCTIKWTQK